MAGPLGCMEGRQFVQQAASRLVLGIGLLLTVIIKNSDHHLLSTLIILQGFPSVLGIGLLTVIIKNSGHHLSSTLIIIIYQAP